MSAVPLMLQQVKRYPNLMTQDDVFGEYDDELQMCPGALYFIAGSSSGTGPTGTLGEDPDSEDDDD